MGMITDPGGRYLLTQLNSRELWHYDKRWRKYELLGFGDEKEARVYEGVHHLCSVVDTKPGEALTATVYSAEDPKNPIATAVFDNDKWTFEGDKQAWAWVPEYILVPLENDQQALLRIADNCELFNVSELGKVIDVVPVPDNRIVLLIGEGKFWVFDPISHRSFWSQQLAQANPRPVARFRNNEEVWINDLDTMLKLEAKKFEIIDGAGSDISDQGEAHHGHFGRWTFAAQGELCVITRPSMGDVLVIDALSMAPVAQGVFRASPVDAMLVGRNTLVGVAEDGSPLRTRARRVPRQPRTAAPEDTEAG